MIITKMTKKMTQTMLMSKKTKIQSNKRFSEIEKVKDNEKEDRLVQRNKKITNNLKN